MISIPHANSIAERLVRRSTSEKGSDRDGQRERRPRYRSKNCRMLARLGSARAASRRHARESRAKLSLEKVQQQIAVLERRQTLAQAAILVRNANAAAVASNKLVEYYRHFSRGYNPDRCTPGVACNTEALVRALILEDVTSPTFQNIDTFLAQYRDYSRYHSEMATTCVAIEPVSCEDPGVHIVKCSGSTSLRISRDTIQHFFKPLLEDEAMVQRLIGQEYSFPFVTCFYFNHTGRVFKMEPRADLAAGLFDLVTDPFATVKLLGASKLTEDGCLHAYTE